MDKRVRAKDIRPINRQYDGFRNRFIMEWLISYRLSPFFSAWFVNKKVSPNQVTLLMIGCGLLGAVLSALPNIICKIVGAIFIHLWFVMDCSDGEVARYTKQYSTFGQEMDFVAHVITHPFFIISFCLSFMQLYHTEGYKIVLIFLMLTISEFLGRTSIEYGVKIEKYDQEINKFAARKTSSEFRNWISYISTNLWAFPNYVLIFPFLYGFDVLFQTSFFLYVTVVYVSYCFIINLRHIFRCLFKFISRN